MDKIKEEILPGSNSLTGQSVNDVKFVSTTSGSEDFHVQEGSSAISDVAKIYKVFVDIDNGRVFSKTKGHDEYKDFPLDDALFYSRNQSGNVISEYDDAGRVFYTNIYGIGLIGKEVYDEDNFYSKSLYYLKNHLGSTMKIIDDQGENQLDIQYYAYGVKDESNNQMPGIDATETFTGKPFDEDGSGDLGLGIDLILFGPYVI